MPYSSGKVGMFGLSYYGFTQLLAAAERPPHLYAIFPCMTLNDQRNGSFYQNGALKSTLPVRRQGQLADRPPLLLVATREFVCKLTTQKMF